MATVQQWLLGWSGRWDPASRHGPALSVKGCPSPLCLHDGQTKPAYGAEVRAGGIGDAMAETNLYDVLTTLGPVTAKGGPPLDQYAYHQGLLAESEACRC
jgi:hypothetical protein